MYGSAATRKANAESGSAAGHTSTSPTTATTSDGKDHAISRQILNPGGDKYDEVRFGAPAGADTRTGDLKQDPSVKRQVLDPSSSSKDESGYGATEFAGHDPATNPTGAAAVRPEHSTAGSALSMKSGILGKPDQHTEERALRSDGITGQGGLGGASRDETPNFSRNAAVVGAGAAADAGGAYAATRPHDHTEESTHTDRSFPLSGGAIAPHSDNRQTSSTYSSEAPVQQSTTGNATHIPGLNTGTAGGVGAASGEAALANLGLERHSAIDHSGHSHEFNGDPCETEPAEKTLPHVPGPHATVAANMLDPHVPGEFPTEDGLDPHSSHATGFGHATESAETSSEHHLGRDAALLGGAGAVGLGAHEASKSHNSSVPQPASTTTTNAGVRYPSPLGSHEALADRTVPTQQPTYSPSSHNSPALASSEFPSNSQAERSSNDHHLGRNAALAGGAGAAGLGAYEATKDRSDPADLQHSQGAFATRPGTSEPATYQPITQSQSPQHVAGNPLTGAKEPQQEHHYGRDAALVGGAGAAGYGAKQYLDDRHAPSSSSAPAGNDGIVTEPTTGLPMNVGKYGSATGGTDANPAIASHYNNPPVGSDVSRTQQPLDQNKEHHYGRDAAIVGGAGAAGAAGYGAYEYSKDRGQTDPTSTGAAQPYSSTANTISQPGQATTSSTAYPSSQPAQQQPLAQDREHHYGRDAALVGGAGAAGAAGYAALQNDRGDTGPASKTVGPHSSNIANIVDPRVRPEPEKMKDHTTAGPWQSDTLNKLDPKVESDPNKADVKAHGYATGVATQPVGQQQQQLPADQDKDHHYGRDAAIVGGTGAAAYGATQAYDQHEQEKLAKEQAKEQEKQAKHDAKVQEKEAKHDAKEQEKQAKHDAKEAEKAHEKEEKKHAKEQEKLDKHHAKEQEKAEEKRLKEQEKAEEKRLKEQEKAEEKRQKELEKLQHEKEKEDAKLAAARHNEAEAKHKHNKLHKEAPEEREDKGGIIHRIFHHKHYEREGAEGTSRTSGSFEEGRSSGGLGSRTGEEGFERRGVPSSSTAGGESGLGKSSFEQPGLGGEGDGLVKDSTTGLPMNVGKYGHGVGGTDGNEAIAGHYKQ